MKQVIQIFFMLVALALVVNVVASAVAQDATNSSSSPAVEIANPEECDSVMSVLLQKKKDTLDRRERTIKAKESDLLSAEERIKMEIEKLTQLRNEMRESMKELDAQQLAEVEKLVQMFEKMRGKKAAAILEQADKAVAVEVLRRMREKQAGEALSAMTPAYAAGLAKELSDYSVNK